MRFNKLKDLLSSEGDHHDRVPDDDRESRMGVMGHARVCSNDLTLDDVDEFSLQWVIICDRRKDAILPMLRVFLI